MRLLMVMLSDELLQEIEKWTRKLDKKLSKVAAKDESGEEILENARAYREDTNHFLEDGDLIKSFECLIWAWAMLEIGKELDHLKSS